jgi:hypothetical protein
VEGRDVTHGTLRRELPPLEPDDEFIDRLAQLAAASRPTRGGVVVPAAFGRPAARTVAAAAAVAALTAGAAAAATHLPRPDHTSPTSPITSIGTPHANDDGDQARDDQPAAGPATEVPQDGALAASNEPSPVSDPGGSSANPSPEDHGTTGPDRPDGDDHHGDNPGQDPAGDNGDDDGNGPSGNQDVPGDGGGDSGDSGQGSGDSGQGTGDSGQGSGDSGQGSGDTTSGSSGQRPGDGAQDDGRQSASGTDPSGSGD